ncbi:hypothetical protein CVU37_12185 [candidate division BRC1 bacterium HGW-BRC1-1]|jgi:hypothetical protein|nr:MAG: hypothetical protein CVU37_12185 [candidate division BRC1 bacterium HGW-BRC1-1]
MNKTKYVSKVLVATLSRNSTVLSILIVVGVLIRPHIVTLGTGIILCFFITLYRLLVWRGLMRPLYSEIVADDSLLESLSGFVIVMRMLDYLLNAVAAVFYVIWIYRVATDKVGAEVVYYVYFSACIATGFGILRELKDRLTEHPTSSSAPKAHEAGQ